MTYDLWRLYHHLWRTLKLLPPAAVPYFPLKPGKTKTKSSSATHDDTLDPLFVHILFLVRLYTINGRSPGSNRWRYCTSTIYLAIWIVGYIPLIFWSSSKRCGLSIFHPHKLATWRPTPGQERVREAPVRSTGDGYILGNHPKGEEISRFRIIAMWILVSNHNVFFEGLLSFNMFQHAMGNVVEKHVEKPKPLGGLLDTKVWTL